MNNVGHWIEIPACRIYQVPYLEWDEYTMLNEDGSPVGEGGMTYRVIRNNDGKVFKRASFVPVDAPGKDCFYLEEI